MSTNEPSTATLGTGSTAGSVKLQRVWWKSLTGLPPSSSWSLCTLKPEAAAPKVAAGPRVAAGPQSGCWPPKWLHTTLRAREQSVARFHSPGIVHDLTAAQHCQSCLRTISAALKLSNVSPKLPTSEATFFFWKQAFHSSFQAGHSVKGTDSVVVPQSKS